MNQSVLKLLTGLLVAIHGTSISGAAAEANDVEALREQVHRLRTELAAAEKQLADALRTRGLEPGDAEAIEGEEATSLAPKVGFGPVTLAGALRANYIMGHYPATEGPSRGSHGGNVRLDTLRVGLALEADALFGAVQYRWYDGANFLHSAYLGYRLPDTSELQLGLHQLPFGVQPYLGRSWFFQLPFYVGLEDEYDLGLKYIRDRGPWSFKAAYYAMDGGNYVGASRDSARYSYDLVKTGDTRRNYANLVSHNKQGHQGNLRGLYTWSHDERRSTEAGLSAQASQVVNDRAGDGYMLAGAAHLDGRYGPWGVRLQTTRHHYRIHRVDGLSSDIVVMGAFDFPYEVASRATLYSAGLSYTWLPHSLDWLDDVTFYADYTLMTKDGADELGRFDDSHQAVFGALWHAGPVYVYTDLALGNGAPFVGYDIDNSTGQDNFVHGLSSNRLNEWLWRFNLNFGYYW